MLRYNQRTGEYVVISDDEGKAQRVGLTLSTTSRGPNGEKVWFTDTPYAALAYWNEADSVAMPRLQSFLEDFRESKAVDSPYDFPAPEGLEYRGFQKAGIAYALKRRGTLIGDQPGLGKTVQAIGVANALDLERVLVVCPASIREQWSKKVHEWSTMPGVTTYPIYKSSQGVAPNANWTITSYDLARHTGIHECLMSQHWDLIVLDEAHYLKTVEAERTRAVFGGGEKGFKDNYLLQQADRVIALSGTPIPNRPRECYTLARGLCWESIDYASRELFEYRFNTSVRDSFYDSRERKWKTIHVEVKGRAPELGARLRCNFMVRRMKKDVLHELPEKQIDMVYIEPDGKIRELLRREELIEFDPKCLFNPDFKIDDHISTLRREMGEALAPRVVEYVKYLMDVVEVPKIMLTAHHSSVMDALVEGLHQYGVIRRDGSTSAKMKERGVEEFVENPDLRIWLAQNDTVEGADGVQEVCEWAVSAEPAWNPGRNEQILDRLHRMGQRNAVIGQMLLVEGSMNEKVLDTVLNKAHDIHNVLDRED